jgi:hypothetical protein
MTVPRTSSGSQLMRSRLLSPMPLSPPVVLGPRLDQICVFWQRPQPPWAAAAGEGVKDSGRGFGTVGEVVRGLGNAENG